MNRFQIGDDVRIVGLPTSQWHGDRGRVVEVIDSVGGDAEEVQECAVNIAGERRWFRADHLVKSVPGKWVRFFRAEALDRWQLNPDDVAALDGDHVQLIALLQDRHDFSGRRAQAEVGEFISMLYERINRATAIPVQTPQNIKQAAKETIQGAYLSHRSFPAA